MENKIADIKKAVEGKAYLSALALSLTLPDICCQVEIGGRRGIGADYITWFDKYVYPKYFKLGVKGYSFKEFTGSVCYALRCAYLHSGSFDVENDKYNVHLYKFELKVDLEKNEDCGWIYSLKNGIGGYETATIDVVYLCKALCEATQKYYDDTQDKSLFDDHICRILL